jgi:long-chain acyl-CoA synthetase
LVCGNERYTYAHLEDRVTRCAKGLRNLGATTENGVALVLKNSSEFVFSYLAASSLGIPAVLVDPGSRSAELQRIFSENKIALAVCDPENRSALELTRNQTGEYFFICSRGKEFEDLMNHASAPGPRRVEDSETAIVQYTSGTTGVPKCIARSHRNLFCEAENFIDTTGISADDRILCSIPLFHSHGFGNALLAALYAGATLVLTPEFNRAAVVELLSQERITIFPAVPFMFDLLSRWASGKPRLKHSLRLVFSAGAPLLSTVATEFNNAFGIYPRQLYGASEVGSAAINLDPDLPATLNSVGLPMKNVSIQILQEDESPVAEGEVGEVAIQSAAMASGYLRQPELTQQRFRHGCFWPGDYGRTDSRGNLYIERRADWIVTSAGRKVDPHEVEAVIATFPKVREVVVIGVSGYRGEQVIKAVVVSHEAFQEREVVSFCREKLADFKIPRLVEFVQEIPRSATGKILRKHLVS